MCKYLCFPNTPISFFFSLWMLFRLCLIFQRSLVHSFRLLCWSVLWSGSIAFHSEPQIALVCRDHCSRGRSLISHSPYIPSLAVKGEHMCCLWERRASTGAFQLVLVFPDKPNTHCVRTDWHIRWFHCNKYQCPSVNCRSTFPIHTLGCIFKVITVLPALTYSFAVTSLCSILPKPTECCCLSLKSFPRLTDVILYIY